MDPQPPIKLQPLTMPDAMDQAARCETCYYFLPAPIDPKNLKAPVSGLCRRYPPGIAIAAQAVRDNMGNGKFPPALMMTRPQVAGIDWCGEYNIGR